MTKKLYLLRHGQTDWNVQRRLQGHSDICLNERGRSQAQALQSFFRQNPVEKVFSSDLQRAAETAAIATAPLGLEVVKFASLREVRLGEIEGKPESEIIATYGAQAWEQWTSWRPGVSFAYPGGETHPECVARMLLALENLFLEFEFQTAAACSHGLLIRRLAHHLRPEWTETMPIPNCGVFELEWSQQKIRFNGLVFSAES